ncbi:hypothetical protein [Streptomyces sp. NBC_01334]|uniref:hypothetical protein n=1 Tax=Streptomyces sp. NBC_01334 TaxID=2903827 RepID=UPI002E12B694|nr:hypothetical protein OG736_45985 [Streptomyces sp. NBC_01334]
MRSATVPDSHDRPADLAAPPKVISLPAGIRFETVTDAVGVGLLAEVDERAVGTVDTRLRERLPAPTGRQ